MINYKIAYQNLYKAYKALLKTQSESASVPLIIDWILDGNRGSAITSFTEGPERQIAYVIEVALKRIEPCQKGTEEIKKESTESK